MNEEDIADIREAMEGLRRAIMALKNIQDHKRARLNTWTTAQPIKALQEWSMWLGFVQTFGHILLAHHDRLSQLIAQYYEARAKMDASPAPPHPDEGFEEPQTPIPDYLKDVQIDV